MSLADLVSVTVLLSGPGVTLPGFGRSGILSRTAAWVERSRTYTTTAGVGADFATTTPEYKAASAIFAQTPRPPDVKILRCALAFTQVHVVGVLALGPTGTKYEFNFYNQGVRQLVTYTSVGGNVHDDIIDGLVAALNALAAPAANFTAAATGTGGSKVCTITADGTNNWAACESLNRLLISTVETTADPGQATDLNAIVLEDSDWFGLVDPLASAAVCEANSSWAESNRKLYGVSLAETSVATVAYAGATDTAKALVALAPAFSYGAMHPRREEFMEAAEQGRWFPVNPGGDNWRYKTLSGVTAQHYTPTEVVNIRAKHCAYYDEMSGVNVVEGDGVTFSGEYIDVTRFVEKWTADVRAGGANLMIQNEKIPFTDGGVARITSMIRKVNKQGIGSGGISPNPEPTVSAPLVADVSGTDKSNRHLPDVLTDWTLAGAINSLAVTATVVP